MRFFTDDIRNNIKVIFLALILALAVGQADAQYYVPWEGASNQPPGCFSGQKGCDAPLNVSSVAQTKKGGLRLNTDDTGGAGLVVGGSAHVGLAPADARDLSAQLEVKSTNKGFLPPRIASTASITSPATGLLIYNTASNEYQYYNGSAWKAIGGGAGVPPKTVVLFYGSATDLTNLGSTVWQKCDGTNSTPKLDGVTMTGDNLAAIPVYYICKR